MALHSGLCDSSPSVHPAFSFTMTQPSLACHEGTPGPPVSCTSCCSVKPIPLVILTQETTFGFCRLNGTAVGEHGYEMHAAFGRVTAADCALIGTHAAFTATVNSSSCFSLTMLHAHTTGRLFDGTEDVTAFVSGQLSAAQPVLTLTPALTRNCMAT